MKKAILVCLLMIFGVLLLFPILATARGRHYSHHHHAHHAKRHHHHRAGV